MASGNFGMRGAGSPWSACRPAFAADGVHANPVAQQGAAGFAAGGIGADDGHPMRMILQVMQHAQDQLIGQGGLCRRRPCR
jgi:hypothetical protein